MEKTILYIEDDANNSMLIRRVLEAMGYLFLEANTGEEGLFMAISYCPDMILIDIDLPDISGYEVTKRLRRMPELTQIPILAITAHAMKADKEKSLQAGCNDYISKPIDIEELPHQMAKYFKGSNH